MAKGEIDGLSNFFFCHYVFKKSAAAEASESVYMRERVKLSFVGKMVCCVLVRTRKHKLVEHALLLQMKMAL